MATSTTTKAIAATPKMHPPPPPRIRTSSIGPNSSTSPAMGSKRPPSLPRQSSASGPPSATATGRPQRNRKETQRLRSMSRMPQDGLNALDTSDGAAKPPLVRDSDYILRKFKGQRPSLIVHLHQSYFRFDQQDGHFSYQSPMKSFLDHLKLGTVPHDMLEELHLHNVSFYDGCLIVEVHNHRSTTKGTDSQSSDTVGPQQRAYDIHARDQFVKFVTPSPYVPYPSPANTPEQSPPSLTHQTKQDQGQSDSIRASTGPTKVFTKVLHPTQQSLYRDLLIEATSVMPDVRGNSKKAQAAAKEGATPMSAYPPTPLSSIAAAPVMSSKSQLPKRQRMRLEEGNVHLWQSEVLKATEPVLLLEPAVDFQHVQSILAQLTHPLHNNDPPKRNGRKRTHAELEADEAAAAEEERIALMCDSRLNPYPGAAGPGVAGVGEGHDTSNTADMNFNSFKRIEDIRTRHEEQSRAQTIAHATHEQELKAKQARTEALAQKQMQLKQQSEEQNMREMHNKNKRAQNEAMGQGQTAQMRNNNPTLQQNALQHLRHQQASQAQHQSPNMSQNPSMGSSPITGHPMNRGGAAGVDSPRPGPAMQFHQNMAQPMARQPSQQQSQGSQSRTATPQMPNMTPHLPNNVPQMTPQMQQQQMTPVNNGHLPGMPMPMQGSPPNQAQMVELMQRQRLALGQPHHGQMQGHMAGQGQQPGLMGMSPQQQARMRAMQAGMAGNGMPNGSLANQEYKDALVAQLRSSGQQQAQLQQRQQQQQQQQHAQHTPQQQHQPTPQNQMTPTTSGMPFNSNMATAGDMMRQPSQQQFAQNGMPNMQQASPHQQNPQQLQNMSNQNPNLSQMTPQQIQKVRMQQALHKQHEIVRQRCVNHKPQILQRAQNENGGVPIQDPDAYFERFLRQKLSEVPAMMAQQQKQVQAMQAQRMAGQNMAGAGPGMPGHNMQGQNMPNQTPQGQNPNFNMNVMRQNMAQGRGQPGNPGQNPNFNPQMSPHMNMQNMPGNMQPGMNMGPNRPPLTREDQIRIAQMRAQHQQQQQQAMAQAAAANGGVPMNRQMQMGSMQGGQMHGQGRGGG